jgi:hypothetical protein
LEQPGYQNIPPELELPRPKREWIVHEPFYRYMNELLTRLEEAHGQQAIVTNNLQRVSSLANSIIEQQESSAQRDLGARELDLDAGVMVPGAGPVRDSAIIVFASPMSDVSYCVTVDNYTGYNVVAGGPVTPINIKRHWVVDNVTVAGFVLSFYWTVTAFATADNLPLLLAPVATEFDNYAALLLAHGPLAAPYGALLGSGLENFTYRIGDIT